MAVALLLGAASAASAANVTWNGAGINNLWSNGANWSTTFPPSIADVAVFDATSTKNCTIDVAVSITGISIAATYTGGAGSTITQNSGCTVVLGASGFVQAAGTFTTGGAATDQLVTPVFNQTGGTFGGSGTVLVVSATSQNFNATSTLPNVVFESPTEYGLVGYWKLDGSGATEPDSSGLGHTATVVGAAPTSTAHPTSSFYNPASRTCDVGATKKYLTVTGSTDFSLAGAFTVSAWVHVVDNGSQNYVVRYSSNASSDGFVLAVSSSPNFSPGIRVYGGTSTQVTGPSLVVSPATWYHIAGVYDGANVILYRNGTAYGPTARATGMTVPATSNTLFIGGAGDGNTCQGEVDDVRIYNRALAPTEVQALANGFYGPGPGGSVTFTLTSPLTVSGNLTVVSGALDVSGSNRAVTVGGSLKLYGGFAAQAGTVTLNGTGSNTLHSGGNRFNNLTVSNSGTWTLDDRLDVIGTLAISAGVIDVSTGNWSIHAGTLNQSAASTSLVPRSGKLVMDGSAGGSVTASTTLNALRIEDPTEAFLIGYWKFDLATGATERDVSGGGSTATRVGGVVRSTSTPSAVLFDDPASAQLDGATGYYDLGTAASLNAAANGGFAVCGWVNTTESYGPIVSLRANGTGNPVIDICVGFDGLDGTINAGKLMALVRDDTGGALAEVVGGAINSGTWRHFAVVRDTSGFVTTYIDGVSQGTSALASTGAITTDLRSFGVERKWLTSGAAPNQNVPDKQYLNASIDDIRAYGRALTAAEVRNLANGRYVSGTSGTATWALAANLATASLGVDAGTFNANGFTTTIANAFTLQQGQGGYTAGSGLQTFNGGLTVSGSAFTGGSGMVTVNGAFSQVGTVDANGGVAQSGGAFTAPSGAMVVTGNLSVTAGTFTHNSGTVVMKAAASRTLTCTQPFNHLVFGDGLIGCWRFEEGSSPSLDESGLGHHATWSNATQDTVEKPTLATANVGAMSFNGTNAVLLPTVSPYLDVQRFTVTCWERCNATWSGQTAFLGYNTPGGSVGYSLETNSADSTLAAWVHQPAGWQGITVGGWTKGVWQHYGATFDGAQLHMFRNGVEIGTPVTTASSGIDLVAGMAAKIGRHAGDNTGGGWFRGHLDELRFYDRAMTGPSIAQIYLGGVPAAAGTFSLGSAVTAIGDLTIASGALDCNGNDLTIGGSWKNLGGTFAAGTRTVTFNGTASGKTIESRGQRFANLAIASNPSGGVWTLADRLDVASTLTISAGQLDVSTSNWPIHCGTLNQSGASTTLVPRSGTIVVDSPTGGTITATTTLNALRVEDPTETGLMGYWKFDLRSGLSERDASGNPNTGTLTNGAVRSTAIPATPLFDNALSLSLDGVDDYVDGGSDASLNLTGAVTVCAWVKLGATGRDQKVIARQGPTGLGGYKLSVFSSNVAEFEVRDAAGTPDGNRNVAGGVALAAGTWYHLAGVYSQSGQYLRTFVNGAPDRYLATTTVMAASAGPLLIGADYNFNSLVYFGGQIDDVRVYNRVLTDAEIRNLANGRYAAGANGTGEWTLLAPLATTTLGIDAGTFNANGFATTVTNLFTLRDGQGAYLAGSATQTFNGGVTMSGSTFTGGNGTVAVNGDFTQSCAVDANGGVPQSGGTFTAPSGTMTITGSVVHGGTFVPNGGLVQLTGGAAGKTLSGPPRGGGLIGSYVLGDLRGVFENDWRATRAVTATRLDGLVWFSGPMAANLFGTAAERAAFGIGGADSGNGWDGFSVQWDGWLNVVTDGTTIKTRSDDYSRVWIDFNGDGAVQAGEWGENGWSLGGVGQSATQNVIVHQNVPRGLYRIRVQYEEGNGLNEMDLLWTDSANSGGAINGDYLIPASMLAPAANGGGLGFANLQVTGAGSWTVNDPLTATGTITCSAGTLVQATAATITAGAWSSAGGTFTGAGAGTRSDQVTVAGTLGCSSGTFTSPSTRVTVGGAMTINGGTFVCPSGRLLLNGDLTVSSGTFTHNSGTVMMKSASNRTLTCTQAFNHLAFSDGLIARWRFEEASTAAIDASGWGHTATWYNGPAQDAAVKPTLFQDNASSLSFDGVDDYVDVPDSSDFRPANKLTIAGWVYLPTGSNVDEGGLIGRGSGTGMRGWSLYSQGTAGQLMFRLNTTGAGAPNDNILLTNISLNAWHHVAITTDGTLVRGYLDGALNAAGNFGTVSIVNPPSGFLYIGKYPTYGGYAPKFLGKLDDLRFYDRNLSASDIARLASGREPATSVATFTLASALTVAGDLTIGSGTLDLNSRAVSVGGAWRCSGLVTGASTVTFNGSAGGTNEILSGQQSFNNVAITGSSSWRCLDWFRTGGALTQTAGTLYGNTWPVTIGGNLTVGPGQYRGTTDITAIGGSFSDSSTNAAFIAGTGFVELTGTTDQSVDLTSLTNQFWVASGANSGMAARFRFDEAHGSSAIDDVSGLIATSSGTPTPSPATPFMWTANPYCLDFTGPGAGNNDVVQLPATAPLDALNLSSCSFSAWVYPRTKPPGPPGSATGGYGIIYRRGCGLYFDSTGRFELDDQLSDDSWGSGVTAANTSSLGAWHHVCGVIDASAHINRLYVDGLLAGTTTYSLGAKNFGSAPWWIGAIDAGAGGYDYADCLVDDVRLYSRALAANEVVALSNSGYDAANGSATFLLSRALGISGDVVLLGGTLSANGANAISAAAAWRNYVGNTGFNGGSGTVTLSGGSQQIYGSTTFNALTKTTGGATLTFPINECQTFTGALTLQGTGAGASLMNIRSSSPGTRATIRPTGTRTVAFLSVMDSRNFVLPILAPRATTNCVDAGNTRWWFDATAGGNGVLVGAPGLD